MDKVFQSVKKALLALNKPPPPIYDPTTHTMRGWIGRFREVATKEGFWTAYNKLRMETRMRGDGYLVGTDYNGNRYFENPNAPYGRTRWVEYPTVPGVWALEDKYDASMVAPDWHGWLHYSHDTPGNIVSQIHSKPFKQQHRVNQTMLRPEYTTPPGITSKEFDEGLPAAFHKPPGAMGQDKPRGKLGPKYQPWDPSGKNAAPQLRNYADNTKILDMP